MSGKIPEILATAIPTIARTFGGPLGGLAADAICKALGLDPKKPDEVAEVLNSQLSADQIVALKKAEQELTLRLKELDISLEAVDAGDRANARALAIATGGQTQNRLGLILVLGFLAFMWGIASGHLQLSNSEGVAILTGGFASAFGSVMTYFFGSSHGSVRKDFINSK